MIDIDEKKSIKKQIVKRPWGNFEQFTYNEKTTVMLININAKSEMRLQYHEHRNEFWRVLSGHPIIVVGDKIVEANKGDEFFVPKLTEHQIKTTESSACILEIAFGQFDEDDIVKINNLYKGI